MISYMYLFTAYLNNVRCKRLENCVKANVI
jgi:hypothetical protein